MDMTTLHVSDKDGKNDLKIDIDWDNRHGQPVLHARMGEAKATLDANEFWQIAFMLANADKQSEMIPVNTQATRHFSKLVKIKATKKIKAGEEIIAKVNFSITDAHLKKIFGEEKKHTSGIVITEAPKATPGKIIT